MLKGKRRISSAGRTVVLAAIAALVVTASDLPLTAASASQSSKGVSAKLRRVTPRISVRRAIAGITIGEGARQDWRSWGWRSERLPVQSRLNNAATITTTMAITTGPAMADPITTAADIIIPTRMREARIQAVARCAIANCASRFTRI